MARDSRLVDRGPANFGLAVMARAGLDEELAARFLSAACPQATGCVGLRRRGMGSGNELLAGTVKEYGVACVSQG